MRHLCIVVTGCVLVLSCADGAGGARELCPDGQDGRVCIRHGAQYGGQGGRDRGHPRGVSYRGAVRADGGSRFAHGLARAGGCQPDPGGDYLLADINVGDLFYMSEFTPWYFKNDKTVEFWGEFDDGMGGVTVDLTLSLTAQGACLTGWMYSPR